MLKHLLEQTTVTMERGATEPLLIGNAVKDFGR